MDKRIPNAEIRRVWADMSLTTAEAAAQVGLSRSSLWLRARALNLPPRAKGRREVLPTDQLVAMWNAGVLSHDIAAHFGCHFLTVCQTARRLKLARRALGRRQRVTLADFLQAQTATRMAQFAAVENSRLKGLVE